MMYYKGEPLRIRQGDTEFDYTVSFRLMLFAPFISEVITGKIISTSKAYVRGESLLTWFGIAADEGHSQYRLFPRYLYNSGPLTS